MRATSIGMVFLLYGAAAAAQAPVITAAGDPSIESDTIYRLAVDPKDRFPEWSRAASPSSCIPTVVVTR